MQRVTCARAPRAPRPPPRAAGPRHAYAQCRQAPRARVHPRALRFRSGRGATFFASVSETEGASGGDRHRAAAPAAHAGSACRASPLCSDGDQLAPDRDSTAQHSTAAAAAAAAAAALQWWRSQTTRDSRTALWSTASRADCGVDSSTLWALHRRCWTLRALRHSEVSAHTAELLSHSPPTAVQ